MHDLENRVTSIPAGPSADSAQKVAARTFSAVFELAEHYDDLSPPLVNLVQGYKADVHAVPLKPTSSMVLDKKEAERWIQAHPLELRDAARAAVESVIIISQETFEEELSRQIEWVNHEMEGKGLRWSHASRPKINKSKLITCVV